MSQENDAEKVVAILNKIDSLKRNQKIAFRMKGSSVVLTGYFVRYDGDTGLMHYTEKQQAKDSSVTEMATVNVSIYEMDGFVE